jgi:ribosomal protein S18 acetylase RimI-like enzyme
MTRRKQIHSQTASSTIVITLMGRGQITSATKLFAAQLREHGITTGTGQIREAILKILADERLGFVLVAENSGKRIVGVALCSSFLGVEHGGVSGWLEELYVHPSCRGAGVGTRLTAEVIRQARARGWKALDIEVDIEHRRVVSLYERQGFRPLPRSRHCLKLDPSSQSSETPP